ncbi:MAG TPA: hypothetical protein VM510_05520 [Caulifigura sp.]|nr:hypothetical protein [Caulifigura sp.]
MFRRRAIFDFACLPAVLVGMAASWAQADEPFPFPAPPVRSHSSVYLTPETVTAPAATKPRPSALPSPKRLTQLSGATSPESKAESGGPRGGLVPPARKSVVADSSETDRRIERLQRQLDQLNEMLSRPPVEPPVIERLMTPPVADEPVESPQVVAPPRVPDPPAAEITDAPKPSQPAPVELKPEVKPAPGKLSANGLIKGLPVAAIDRVHVADNLFAAGEYLLANEIYEQVDRRSVSSDESGWVEFQLANCSRRLGRLDDAKKRYRRVVADPTLGWLQDMAKWRLDAIDEREHLMKDHARLEAAIKQYSEAPRAATKP